MLSQKEKHSGYKSLVPEFDEENVVVVGDSMVRNQQFYTKKNNSMRRVHSYSGASLTGTKNIKFKIDEFTKGANNNTMFFVQVGTNDLLGDKSSITPKFVIEKYKSIIKSIREKSHSNNIYVLGLLPVIYESLDDITDRKDLNYRLNELAREENIKFASFWNEFAQPPNYKEFYNYDGIHLSKKGESYFSDLLQNLIENFQMDQHS